MAVRADIPMDIEIGDHALGDELGLDEVARQLDGVLFRQFARQGELDFAGQLRILALLGGLDCVPQFLAVGEVLGCAFGQQHFAMLDTCLAGEVVIAVDPLVEELLAGAIGGSGHRAAPARSADDFRAEVEDRHNGNPVTP
jgi:hypothetical protein